MHRPRYKVHERRDIIVPENENEANSAVIKYIRQGYGLRMVIGLDCEWRRHDRPVALMQIATRGHVVLFQTCRFRNEQKIPQELAEILLNENVIKVGVNIQEDVKRIKRGFGLTVRGWVDLCCYAIGNRLLSDYFLKQLQCFEVDHCLYNHDPASVRNKRLNFMPKLGLDALVGACLCKSLKGFKRERSIKAFGNWDAWILPHEMVVYAAADAAASLDVFDVLRCQTRNEILFNETYYDQRSIRLKCLDLISKVAPPKIHMILPEYYSKKDQILGKKLVTAQKVTQSSVRLAPTATYHGGRLERRRNAENELELFMTIFLVCAMIFAFSMSLSQKL